MIRCSANNKKPSISGIYPIKNGMQHLILSNTREKNYLLSKSYKLKRYTGSITDKPLKILASRKHQLKINKMHKPQVELHRKISTQQPAKLQPRIISQIRNQ
jgi:hypothetical protein